MERNYKLYVHIAPNGKRYYGITKQEPEQRWRKGHGYDTQYFARAINKYGWDNIEHIVLQEDLNEEEAGELEQYMIQWYNTSNPDYGYNISLGGECGNFSKETRKKMGEAKRGKNHPMYGKHLSEETKQKLSKAHKGLQAGENHPMYGKHLSKEHKQKIGEAIKGEKHPLYGVRGKDSPNYGKRRTEETRQKMREAAKKGKEQPGARSIICITTNTVFYTVTDGSNYYNIDRGNISACCRGKYKSSGKLPDGTPLVWRYIDIIEL